jgi:lipopolysaccharide/colanic/teichoic acid biosynthesis glycosyltransferase
MMYRTLGKRLLDLALTIPALILLAPLFALLAFLVRLKLGSPVLLRQVRPGLHGQIFTLLKFRTMTDARDADGNLLPDSERLTRLGRFLRKTSMDELPQLWNALKGDMSLVGPRPLFVKYLPYYTERERRRHNVRPGITGLAQISGRNQILWDERLELDVQYVENQSFALDLYILLKTVWKVVARSDIVEAPGTVQGPLTKYRQKHMQGKPKHAIAQGEKA